MVFFPDAEHATERQRGEFGVTGALVDIDILHGAKFFALAVEYRRSLNLVGGDQSRIGRLLKCIAHLYFPRFGVSLLRSTSARGRCSYDQG
jgi:hypothetical protein